MKLLVVDDEARHRKGMMNMIGRLRPDYEVFAAKNGYDALALTEEMQPDIVLTDIRMPQMDGLEFLRRISGLSLRPKVVFLSAYNSFDYAQSALRHGASDYLLKPVDPDKVEAVLERLETDRERESLAAGGAFLYAWLHGSYTPAELHAFTTARQITGPGLTLISEITLAEGQTPPAPERFRERLAQALSGIARIPATTLAAAEDPRSIRFIALLSVAREKLDKLRLSLGELLPAHLVHGAAIRHGLGSWHSDLAAHAPASRRAASTALDYTFYESWKGIVAYEEVQADAIPQWHLDSEMLYDLIVQKGEAEAAACCRDAFVQLASGGRTHPAHVKDQTALLIMKLKSRTRNLIDPAASQRLSAMASAAADCSHFRELIALLDSFVHELNIAQLRLKRGRSEFAAEACTAYLKEHYAEDLTLESVSERYHFNPSYFSTLFKQHTGSTFSEFLTETRLTQAQRLLADPDCPLKIYQIAEQCGYRDAKYFCRLFRKVTGVSPERFRHAALAQGKEHTDDEIS